VTERLTPRQAKRARQKERRQALADARQRRADAALAREQWAHVEPFVLDSLSYNAWGDDTPSRDRRRLAKIRDAYLALDLEQRNLYTSLLLAYRSKPRRFLELVQLDPEQRAIATAFVDDGMSVRDAIETAGLLA
jgi:hypothetical protein